MKANNLPLLIAEALKRSSSRFRVEDHCFDKQVAFIRDPAPFKTAVCSRRSGKTVACAADLIETATKNPDRVCLYITLSRNNAKKIIWKDLLAINLKFNLQGHIDNTELSITFPNRSVIYVSGAKDPSEIEKFRGLAITLCYIDECQSFKDYIRDLIDEVIGPALLDYAGKLCLIGTPGPVPAGYFYQCSHNPEWANHAWTYWDNPHIAIKSKMTHREVLDRELKRRGVTIESPSIQREFFGKWTIDVDCLVFKYTKEKNDFKTLPANSGKWEYVFGVDLGHDDADAISVLGWNQYLDQVYLVEEVITRHQGVTELAEQIQKLIDVYDPNRIVMDTGALGKKIALEMQKRFSLPIVAAEKTRKFEYIELLNDALRSGRFFAKADSTFAQDCMLVEWDMDKSKSDKLVVSDRFHSDATDSALYAFRECLHWLSEREPVVNAYQSPEWFKRQEREMEAAAVARFRDQQAEDAGE